MSNQTNLTSVIPPTEEKTARRGWFASMRNQLILAFALVALIGVSLFGTYSYLVAQDYIHFGIEERYIAREILSDEAIEDIVQEIKGDLGAVVNSGTVQGLIRARDGGESDAESGMSDAMWVEHLQEQFEAMAQSYGRYSQLRYLDENGNEVARVDYDDTQTRRVPASELQNKADRYYFQEAMQVPAGQIYVSRLDLNRERGQIQVPYMPTVRYAMPVFNQQGERRGIVVFNVMIEKVIHDYASPLINEEGIFFFLVNPDGYYAHHSAEPEKEFGGPDDLNTGQGLRADFPEAADIILSGQPGEVYTANYEIFYSPIQAGPDSAQFWVLGLAVPRSIIEAPLQHFTRIFAGVLSLSLMLSVLAGYFLTQCHTAPLEVLRRGARQVAAGHLDQQIQVAGTVEVTDLAAAFNQMAVELRHSFDQIQHRERYLAQLALVGQELLAAEDVMVALPDILARLGQVAGVSRTYVFQNHRDTDGRLLTSQRAEWTDGKATPQIDNPDLQNFPLDTVPRWVETLGRGEVIAGAVCEFPHDERAVLEPQGIRSMLVIPIFAAGDWWGLIGFDDCATERDWPQVDQEMLRTAATLLEQSLTRAALFEEIRGYADQYKTMLSATLFGFWLVDEKGKLLDGNDAYCRMSGYTREELLNLSVPNLEIIEKPEDTARHIEKVIETGTDRFESKHKTKDGRVFDVEISMSFWNSQRKFVVFISDITERKRAEEREYSRNHILTSISAGEPLAAILELIARSVEAEVPEAICSILLLDKKGQHLLNGAAPNLPDFYNQAIHGSKIGNGVGSCGTAAYTKQRVVVEDILTHPYWADFRELAQKANLRSCWSEPILSTAGKVLGTFAIYHREPRSPSSEDIEQIKSAADFASLAIEHKQAEEEIQRENDTRTALNTLLRLSLEDVPLDELLAQALDLILSIPWLAFESSGAIFLAEDEQALVLKSQRGLAEPIQRACARVPFGRCLCGRAAAEQKTRFADRLDVHHETTYEGIGPHGHYCVPILSAGKTLGVISVYLSEGHRRDTQEEKFLLAMADTLAASIERKRVEKEIHQLNTELEQRVAERTAALQKNEIRFRHLIVENADGIAVLDEKGAIRYVNPAAEALFNRPAQELLGMPLGSPAETMDKVIELTLPSTVGEDLVAEVHFVASQWEEQPAFIATLRNVTERKRAEKELRKLSRAIEQSPASVVITNREGRMEYVNPKFIQTTGYTLEEALGQTPRVLKSDVQSKEFYKELWDTILTGDEWRGEFCNKKKNGELYWESASISPIRDEGGEITHFVSVKEDISARKQLEVELKRAKDEADRANHAKSEFLSRMSHELRTPLTAILGFTQLLQMDELNPNQMSHLDQILNSGRHLLDLINEVLDIARIEAGKMNISLESVKLEDAVNEALALIHPLAEARQLSISQKIPSSTDIYVLADRQRFRQVLLNLLSNAVKYNRQGGGN